MPKAPSIVKETRYEVRVARTGVTLIPDRYSKFYKRLKAQENGRLSGPLYGPKQAAEHAREGQRVFPEDTFEVIKVITTRKVVKTIKPRPGAGVKLGRALCREFGSARP